MIKYYRIDIINWDDIEAGKYGGDVILNTTVDGVVGTLNDVWKYLGFRLKKQRCGYAGIRGKKEYRVFRA